MQGKITYTNEILNSHSGQLDGEAGIYVDGEIIGVAQYVLYNGELTISDIFVRPEFRRRGYGSRLIKYIKQENPDYKYVPSMKTEDGSKFIHKDLSLEEEIQAKFVYENLEFERGRDPYKSLKLGKIDIEKLSKDYEELQNLIHKEPYIKFQGDFSEDVLSVIPRRFFNSNGWGNIFYRFKNMTREELFSFKEIVEKYFKLLGLKESINFERGLDPKEALGIGRTIWVRGDRRSGLYKARLIKPYEGPDKMEDEEIWEVKILEGPSKGSINYAVKDSDKVIDYDEESGHRIWGEIDPFVGMNESLDFERGRNLRDVKRELTGMGFIPGEILIENPDDDIAGNIGDVVMFKKMRSPNYAGDIYAEVATLGWLSQRMNKVLNYGSKFSLDNYNISNHVRPNKLRSPTEREEDQIRKYLNKSKLQKIKNQINGMIPILNGKKMIKESLSFERGLDPKEKMGIGLRHDAIEIISIAAEETGADFEGDQIHEILSDVVENPETQDEWSVEYYVDKDIPITDWRNLHSFSGKYVMYDGTYYLIPYINYNE